MEPLSSNDRFENIESVLAQLLNSQKHLLHAQVIMSDRLDRTEVQLAKLAEFMQGMAERMDKGFAAVTEKISELTEAQKQTDERMDALVAVVDDIVRRNGSRGADPPQ